MAKKKKIGEAPALNLKPAMNMILILIPLLLTSIEYLKIAVINVSTPQIGPASTQQSPEQKPDEKPLKFTMALTDRGITLYAHDQVIENPNDPLGPTIPKIDGPNGEKVYDWETLKKKAAELKDRYPTERTVIISAESHIKYKHIIKAMDTVRDRKKGDKKELMFPEVVLSAGVA